MKRAIVSDGKKKAAGFDKAVTIWMRRTTHKAVKFLATKRDSTIQDVIDDLIVKAAKNESAYEPPVVTESSSLSN